MNSAERIAAEWLAEKGIHVRHRPKSPVDFVSDYGQFFEVKRAKKGAVSFSYGQDEAIRATHAQIIIIESGKSPHMTTLDAMEAEGYRIQVKEKRKPNRASAQLLRKLCRQAHWTIGQAAEELGVTYQTLWRWYHGAPMRKPAQRLMRRLMDERKAKA